MTEYTRIHIGMKVSPEMGKCTYIHFLTVNPIYWNKNLKDFRSHGRQKMGRQTGSKVISDAKSICSKRFPPQKKFPPLDSGRSEFFGRKHFEKMWQTNVEMQPMQKNVFSFLNCSEKSCSRNWLRLFGFQSEKIITRKGNFHRRRPLPPRRHDSQLLEATSKFGTRMCRKAFCGLGTFRHRWLSRKSPL
jgi:hypothetical protein